MKEISGPMSQEDMEEDRNDRLKAAIDRYEQASIVNHIAVTGIQRATRFDTEMCGYFRLAAERSDAILDEIKKELEELSN